MKKNYKKCFSFDLVKNKFAHFGGLSLKNFLFQIFFLAVVLWSKRKVQYLKMKKIYLFLRFLFFYSENFAILPNFLELNSKKYT